MNVPTTHKVIWGDARNLDEVADQAVHLVVTSPPYWQLKDYGASGQIGFNDTYDQYINNLSLVWQECHRVLHQGCRLAINIGDQFARSVYYGRYKVIPIRTEIIKACEAIGFDYMGAVIWRKVTTCNTTGGGTVMGSYPYPRNGILKLDYEFILIFKKPGRAPAVDKKRKELSRLSPDEWQTFFSGHWTFSGEKQTGHLAMFPEELPRRLIKMFTFIGDTVLDPFLGSGTTSLAAARLDRHSIGCEINPACEKIIKKKLAATDRENHLHFISCRPLRPDLQRRIAALPYILEKSDVPDKKVDIKKATFGSRVDRETPPRERYFIVEEIISGNRLRLKDGPEITLHGVRENRRGRKELLGFLERELKGKAVCVREHDTGRPPKDGSSCYVYLKNRTFINARLIRDGLAELDETAALNHRSLRKLKSAARPAMAVSE